MGIQMGAVDKPAKSGQLYPCYGIIKERKRGGQSAEQERKQTDKDVFRNIGRINTKGTFSSRFG